jgi:hypothetical protein
VVKDAVSHFGINQTPYASTTEDSIDSAGFESDSILAALTNVEISPDVVLDVKHEIFTGNMKKIQNCMQIIQFYLTLMEESQLLFESWSIPKDYHFFKIVNMITQMACAERTLLHRLVNDGVNTLELEQLEAFQKCTMYMQAEHDLKMQIERDSLALNDWILLKHGLSNEYPKNLRIFPMDLLEEMDGILRFMQGKVSERVNKTNRRMLNVIESLCQIKSKECLTRAFDFTKYFEGQSNIAIGVYRQSIQMILDNFALESAN